MTSKPGRHSCQDHASPWSSYSALGLLRRMAPPRISNLVSRPAAALKRASNRTQAPGESFLLL